MFVNMPFTEKDKVLISNLFNLKGYNGRHLVREFSAKAGTYLSTCCCKSYG